MTNYTQSVLFEKRIFTKHSAKSWLFWHGFKQMKSDDTTRYYRFRQEDPKRFDRFFTIKPKKGILIIIGVIE